MKMIPNSIPSSDLAMMKFIPEETGYLQFLDYELKTLNPQT